MQMQTHRVTLLTTVLMALSACSEAYVAQPPLRGTPDASTKVQNDTRLATGECVFDPGGPEFAPLVGAIGAILASEVAGAAVKTIGSQLTAAGQERTYTVSATRNLVIEEGKSVPCLHFVRGRFHTDPSRIAETAAAAGIGLEGYGDEQHEEFIKTNLWLADRPDLLIELVPMVDKNGIAFEIGYLAYYKALAPLNTTGQETVEVLEMSLRPPGKQHNGEGAPAVHVPLGSLAVPTLYYPRNPDAFAVTPHLRSMQTPWMKIDPGAAVDGRVLVTADVRIGETVPENPLLLTLGEAFTGSAQAVETTVFQSLDPATRAAAETTAFNAAKTSLSDYWTAYSTAEGAIGTCRTAIPADKKAKAIAARGGQELANLLASRAGKQRPYPALINPDATDPC
jgi:hypothetical protein